MLLQHLMEQINGIMKKVASEIACNLLHWSQLTLLMIQSCSIMCYFVKHDFFKKNTHTSSPDSELACESEIWDFCEFKFWSRLLLLLLSLFIILYFAIVSCRQHYCVIIDYAVTRPGGRLNIKMSSYQWKDPHVKDKTASRPSYLYHGNPHTWERLYIETGHCVSYGGLPRQDIVVSYTQPCETSAGCLRSIYLSLGVRQLFGYVTMGQWRHN